MALVSCLALLAPASAWCAEKATQESESATRTGWSDTTDLGLTSTSGNSDTEGIDFHTVLRWQAKRAGFRLKADALLSNTANDPYQQVDPGFTWEPGAVPPPDITTTLVQPSEEPDTEKYYIDARYSRSIRAKPLLRPGTMSWHIGSSWDRNLDAGILSRVMVYTGVGHVWWDRDDLKFNTTYSLSWTDRTEQYPDPEKDDQFPGFRYYWNYENRWGKVVVFHNEWTFNVDLSEFSDYSTDMTSSIRIPMSKRLSLRVSLHWLYNNIPAIEEVDLVAVAIVVDPDGVPGSGDEYFQSVDSGGTAVELGTVQERREKLDTVITTSLGISF